MLSLIVSLIGLILYLIFEPNVPRASKVGFAMFWVGLLAWLLTGAKGIGL